MLSNYIVPGEKVELQAVNRTMAKEMEGNIEHKYYKSQVFEIISDDQVEVTIPMEQRKLILLPVDAEFDVYFYSKMGLFQCFARVIDRYKRDNIYILLLELTTNLRKFQRREFYRFSCALEMNARILLEQEIDVADKRDNFLIPGLPLKRGIIVDISGGGLRFIASQPYEIGSQIYCRYELFSENRRKEYNVVGKIIYVAPIENRPGDYEHRLQYTKIDVVDREEIIKYIFEEERRHRRREKGV